MFHDYRMARAVQEQKLRDAQRCLEEDQTPVPIKGTFRERVVARLAVFWRKRTRDARPKPASADRQTAV